MVNKRFFMGMLALTLIFGFTLSSCDDSSDGGGNNSTTETTIPDVPTGVQATAIERDGNIIIQWLAVSNATGYYVYRSSTATGTYSQVADRQTLLYTDTGLSASTTYYYKVAAYNSKGTSSQSSSVSATTYKK
jgi:fibronectin type 3 domain-containing protein